MIVSLHLNNDNSHIDVVLNEKSGQTNKNGTLRCEDKNVCCYGPTVRGRPVLANFGFFFFWEINGKTLQKVFICCENDEITYHMKNSAWEISETAFFFKVSFWHVIYSIFMHFKAFKVNMNIYKCGSDSFLVYRVVN